MEKYPLGKRPEGEQMIDWKLNTLFDLTESWGAGISDEDLECWMTLLRDPEKWIRDEARASLEGAWESAARALAENDPAVIGDFEHTYDLLCEYWDRDVNDEDDD